MAELIDMWRGGKHAAVHPAEERDYSAHGWVRRVGGMLCTRDPDESPEEAAAPEPEPDAPDDPATEAAPESEPVVDATDPASDDAGSALVSVHKVVDGVQNERASRAGLTQVEAEAYVAARPTAVYVIVAD